MGKRILGERKLSPRICQEGLSNNTFRIIWEVIYFFIFHIEIRERMTFRNYDKEPYYLQL